MSIRVHCEKCKSSHSLNQRMLGRSIRCPVCDATIEVPLDAPSNKPKVQSSDPSQELVDGELVSEDGGDFVEVDVVDVRAETDATGQSGRDGVSKSNSDHSDQKPPPLVADASDEEDELLFQKRQLPKDDMDMTPMVDVTFLLLIFFMITASFTSEKVIEEPPPLSDKASTNAKEEPEKILDTVRVQVDEFNAYTIILPGGEDRQASSKQDLMIALADARRELVTGANDDALKLAVEAHTDSIHASVVAAVDAGREKGFNSIQVTVVEEFD